MVVAASARDDPGKGDTMFGKRQPARVILQIDGAIGAGSRASGLGAVVRDPEGVILQVWSKRSHPQTNNEAEYEALIWALERLAQQPPAEVAVYCDSEIVVYQMLGRFAVHSPALKRLHRRATAVAGALPRVTFTHIPRQLNELADALASEALWDKAPWDKSVD